MSCGEVHQEAADCVCMECLLRKALVRMEDQACGDGLCGCGVVVGNHPYGKVLTWKL